MFPFSRSPISSTRSSGTPRKKKIPYNIRLFPTIALIFLAAGLPLAGHGLVEEDIAVVTKRLEEEPGNTELLLRRATLHRAHEDYSASKADLLAIGRDSPGHLEALRNLARLERENGELADAAAALVRYFAHEGNAPEAFREKARLDTLLDLPESAAKAWQVYLEKADQPAADEFVEAAKAIMATKDGAAAHRLVLRGLERYPFSIPLRQDVASLEIQLGRVPEAEQSFAALRERYPTLLPRLHYQEGTLWLEGGHPQKARGSFQLALQHFDQLPANKQSQPGLQTLRGEILKALQP